MYIAQYIDQISPQPVSLHQCDDFSVPSNEVFNLIVNKLVNAVPPEQLSRSPANLLQELYNTTELQAINLESQQSFRPVDA